MNRFILNYFESSVFSIKKDELTTAASEYSASLSDYGLDYRLRLSDGHSTAKRRVIITDNNLNITFDSFGYDSLVGKSMFHSTTVRALQGSGYFSVVRNSSNFVSCASVPVRQNKKIVGTVSIFEVDTSSSQLFKALEKVSFFSSVFILVVLLGMALLAILFFSKKISSLVRSVKSAHNDNVIDRIVPEYEDEFTPVIDEFNLISDRFNYIQALRQAFVTDASHELRTPLAATKLLCESITQTENIDPDTVREFMEDILLEVDRMSHTAEKLLVLSKLDSASKSTPAPLPLSDIVNKMITTLEPIAEKKDVTIIPYIEENCSILGDMEGANQIVGNLIDNAIKYNNYGGTLRVYLYSDENHCTFITDDTGIGIPPEYRERVFERFFRIDKARSHDGRGGSGLGLAIVKRNVESFGGTITITDSVHGGTRFVVMFPNLSSEEV